MGSSGGTEPSGSHALNAALALTSDDLRYPPPSELASARSGFTLLSMDESWQAEAAMIRAKGVG